MESAVFFRNRKRGVVEFVRVFELCLPLPTYVERKPVWESRNYTFRSPMERSIIDRLQLRQRR